MMSKKISDYIISDYGDNWGTKTLHVLSLEKLDDDFFEILDKEIIKICFGKTPRDLSAVKKRVLKLINKGGNFKKGIVSELLMILYLTSKGYKQEFLFLNLEEESFKKGLDGLYSKNNKHYVFESKSGDRITKKSKTQFFNDKIKLALKGLENSTTGKNENTWNNALSHVQLASDDKALIDKIISLADDLENEKFEKFEKEKFNVIPAGTLFFDNCLTDWKNLEVKDLDTVDTNYLSSLVTEYKSLNVILFSKKNLSESVKLFKKHLKK